MCLSSVGFVFTTSQVKEISKQKTLSSELWVSKPNPCLTQQMVVLVTQLGFMLTIFCS